MWSKQEILYIIDRINLFSSETKIIAIISEENRVTIKFKNEKDINTVIKKLTKLLYYNFNITNIKNSEIFKITYNFNEKIDVKLVFPNYNP